jgi:hypothetical protein
VPHIKKKKKKKKEEEEEDPDIYVKKTLKVPGKVPPPPSKFPQQGPYGEMLRLRSHWFIHSFMSVGVPKKEPSHKMRGSLKT